MMIVFSCRRTAELTSKALDCRLPLGERWGVAAHRLGCGPCRRFRKQLDAVQRAVAESLREDADPGDATLPDATKVRIAEQLNGGPE